MWHLLRIIFFRACGSNSAATGGLKDFVKLDYCRIVRNTKNGWNSILRGHDSEKPVVLYLPNTLELPDNARLIEETDDFLIAILNG